MRFSHTPVTRHHFDEQPFYLKRDDLLHPYFSGNKARKFQALLNTPIKNGTTLVGYGSPQANSLYSLAALAKLKHCQLEFYVDHIPHWLVNNPLGNYRAALALGAKIIAMSDITSELHPAEYIHRYKKDKDGVICIPEGGRFQLAEQGVKQLATEIILWTQQQKIKGLHVALPAGTGCTALYLHKYLQPHGIEVLTCACVGGETYLRQQFAELQEQNYPHILTTDKKHHFGKLYQEDFAIWLELCQQTKVEFELLYDPLMWRCLMPWFKQHKDTPLMYIHQGGLLGYESMLPRYRRRYPQLASRYLNGLPSRPADHPCQ